MTQDRDFDVLAAVATRARADLNTATLARPVPPPPTSAARRTARFLQAPREPVWRRLLRSPVIAGLTLAGFVLGVLVGVNVVGARRTTPGQFVASVSGGGHPVSVATDGRTVWVIDQGRGRLLAFDARSLSREWDVAVGPHPVSVTYGLGAVWVVDSGDRKLRKLAPTDGQLLAQGNTSLDPVAVVVAGDRVWVLAAGNQTIDGYDPQTVREDRAGLSLPSATAAAPGAGVLWVASAGTLRRVPAAGGGSTSFDLGAPARLVAAGTHEIWVATDDGWLIAVDPATGRSLGRVALPGRPTALASYGDGVAVATDDGTVSWVASVGARPTVAAHTGAVLTGLVASQHLLVGVSPGSGLLYRIEITP